MKSGMYLFRDTGFNLSLEAGPFEETDTNGLEEALIDALSEHPWDNDPEYYAFRVDEFGKGSLNKWTQEFLEEMMLWAWHDTDDPNDDDLFDIELDTGIEPDDRNEW